MLKVNRFATDFSVLRQVVLWAQGLAALALFLLFLIPTSVIEGGPTLCLSRILFGVECQGCGMTRAVSCLLHGNISAALLYNRGSVVVLPVLVVLAAMFPLTYRLGGEA